MVIVQLHHTVPLNFFLAATVIRLLTFQLSQFRNNLIMHNIGGLSIRALTTSAIARLLITVRDSAFMHNSNKTIMDFRGNGNQV